MKKSKKTRSTFIALLLLFSGFILLTGCELTQPLPTTREKKPQTTSTTQQQGSKSSSTSQKETTVKPTEASVSLDKNEVTVECFKEVTLNATATGSVAWSSSDESVAKVENGVVKALKPGTATITATCGDKTATCVVTVTVSETIPLLSVDDDVEQIEVLETEGTFEVSVTPYWGLTEFEGDVVYSWKVSDGKDASLIEVTGDGNAATIKGLKAGETEITVSATFNYKSCEVTIPVTVKPASIVAEIETGDHIQLSDSTDYSYVLNLSMLESDSTITEATLTSSVFFGKNDVTENATVTFSVDDNTVASVSDSGKVQALKAGETNVVVTFTYQDSLRGEKTTTVKVHTVVSKLEVTLNEKFTVEVADLAPFTLVSSVDGNVEDLLLGETSILTSFNGNVVTLDGTKLPTTVAGGLGENKEVVLVTDKALYKFNLNIYTKIISNKDDLDGMGAIAKAAANDNGNTWDGYFVLGANIEYNAEFIGLTGKGNLWTSAGDYNALNTRGFKGVFDGKGYNINGMTITKNTYNNQSFGFIAILHPEGVIKNVSFTNAKAIDSDFLSMNIQGLVENVMIHFAELSSEVNIVGVAGGVKNHDNAVMKNCYFDCSNALITGEMIGLIEMEKNWSHKFKVENVFAVLPTGTNGKISEYANFDALRNDATLQEALLTFDSTIWEVVNGVPCFKGLLNDTKLALTNSPLTEVKSGDTIEFEFNKFFYEASLTKADGSETDLVFAYDKISIPNDAKYIGAYKLTVKDAFDETNVYTFEFNVIFALNTTLDKEFDLNYNSSAVSSLENIVVDLSNIAENLGTVESITVDGVEKNDVATLVGATLTVPVSAFGDRAYGLKKVVVKSNLNGYYYITTINTLLISKTINTKEDLDAMGALAKAIANDNGNTWAGYFVLGADIEYNAEYMGLTGKGNLWTSAGDYNALNTRGFKGVFDGKGHNINGMTITKNTYNNQSFGFIAILHPEGIIRNVSFTNAKAIDSDFLSMNIQGLVENVMIHFAELRSENNIVGVVGGVKNHDNAVIRNCYFDCSNAVITGSKIGLVEMEQSYSHKFKAENAFVILPATGNGKVSEYKSYQGLRDDSAAQEVLATFDNTIWTVANGIPCFKGLLNDTKLAVTNNPLTEVKSGDTIEFVFNKNFYEASLSMADGTETDMVYSAGKIVIPDDSKYVGAYKLTVKDAYDSTNVYTFEFSVSYQLNLSKDATYDLNYGTDGKLGLTTLEADFSEDVTDFGTISEVMLDGVSVKDTAVVSYNQGKLTVDVASLGKLSGNHKLVVASNDGGHLYNVTLNALLITKTINTKADLDNMGAIAKAFDGSNGVTYDGYFVLGANIDYNGVYDGMFGNTDNWKTEGGIDNNSTRGFKGVFDGQGHIINGMTVNDAGHINSGYGFIPTVLATGVVRNVGFTNASTYNVSFISSYMNASATYENIYVQYKNFVYNGSNSKLGASTFATNGHLTNNARYVFIDASRCEEASSGSAAWNQYRLLSRKAGEGSLLNPYCFGVVNSLFVNAAGTGLTTGEHPNYLALSVDAFKSESRYNAVKDWPTDFWDLSTGIPMPKSLINSDAIAITNSPLTEAKSGETIEFTVNKYLYNMSMTMADGTETDLKANAGKIVIPKDPKYAGAYKLTITDLFDNTNKYTFEFSVTFALTSTVDELVDLNYSTSGVCGLTNVEIDLSDIADDLGTIESLKIGDTDISEGATLNGASLSIPVSTFGEKFYGDKTVVLASDYNGGKFNITLNLTLATKVINTKADLDNMGAIAKAFSGDNGNTWDGYFALGADIEYNGVYASMFGSSNVWTGAGNWDKAETRGFKGVFDGRGHNIDGMEIIRYYDSTNPIHGGFIPTMMNGSKLINVSFTNASVTDAGFLVMKFVNPDDSNVGTEFKNIYVQYKSIKGDTQDTATFAPSANLNPATTSCYVFVDASKCETFVNSTAHWARARFLDRNSQFNNNKHCFAVGNEIAATQESTNYVFASVDTFKGNSIVQNDILTWDKTFWDVSSGIPMPKNLVVSE